MSSSTQNKANVTLEKSTTNVVNKAGSAAKKAPVKATPKKTNTSIKKTTVKKVASKKETIKKVESQEHVADKMSAFSSTRVWPD